jgi:hypothetical protein
MTTSILRIAPFIVDVTPPIGHPIAYGINNKVDAPIFIRGLLLDDGNSCVVLASADFLYAAGSAHTALTKTIALAANVQVRSVFLHYVHQHDSMFLVPDIDPSLKPSVFKPRYEKSWFDRILRDLGKAVRKAARSGRAGTWTPVAEIATAEKRLSGLAANRRLLGTNGKVHAMRFSMCTDKKLQAEPVGIIDPVLRTIAFLGKRGRLLSTLHFYATHPQIAYGRNMVSSDVPGEALAVLKKSTGPDVHSIYFTGCGANVT